MESLQVFRHRDEQADSQVLFLLHDLLLVLTFKLGKFLHVSLDDLAPIILQTLVESRDERGELLDELFLQS